MIQLKPMTVTFAHTVQAKPNERYTRSEWDCWTFEYILSGKGHLEIDGHTFTLGQGDAYVLPKGVPHGYWADREFPWQKRFFVVNGPLVGHLLSVYGLSTTYVFPDCRAKPWFDALVEARSQGASDQDAKATLLFHEFVIHLANRVRQSGLGYSDSVNKAMTYLNDNVESPVTMEDVAAAAGRSKSHLSRTFHQEVGVTPYEYLIRLRMELAQTLLSLTTYTISEIAERLCYADAYYFSNAFKQRLGASPLAYRERENGVSRA